MPFIKIDYQDIYFNPEVQEMCVSSNFICPYYNHSWSCPPTAPYMKDQIAKYNDFYLIFSKFNMKEYIKKEKKKNPKRSELYIKSTYFYNHVNSYNLIEEFDKFLKQYSKPYSKRLLLYSGTCDFCETKIKEKCSFDKGEPCRYPKERRYSMEAVGIEVIKTVINLNLDIDYPSKTYTYKFGLACFK